MEEYINEPRYRTMKVMELAQELERQTKTKRDIIINTEQMEAIVEKDFSDTSTYPDYGPSDTPWELRLQFPFPNNEGTKDLGLTNWAHRQLAEKCGIPVKYYQKMQTEQKFELLRDNINAWIRSRERRLVRMLDGNVRAILSDRYRVMDHEDVLFFALEKFKEHHVDILRADLSDTRLFIKATVPHIQSEIKDGDKVIQGVIISNSEVGSGSFKVQPFIWRLICQNGLIGPHSIAKIHLGVKREAGELVWQDRTRQLQDDTFRAEIQDVIDATFSQDVFHKWVDQLEQGTDIEVSEPVDAVDNVVARFKLPQSYKENILNHFVKEGDNSQYGLVNSLTRAARDLENYERQIELETVAGEVSLMETVDFRKKIAPKTVA